MSLADTIFTRFGEALVKLPVKIGVLVFVAIILGLSIWGVTELKTDFNIIWFMAPGTYLRRCVNVSGLLKIFRLGNSLLHSRYFEVNEIYFPETGITGTLYVVGMQEYGPQLSKIDRLVNNTASVSGRKHFILLDPMLCSFLYRWKT